jgi:hypothetical protein
VGEKERWALIGRAFADEAILKQLLEAKDLAAIKKAADSVGITINDSDMEDLSTKLGEIKVGDAMGSRKLTIFDAIDAIGKAKHRNEPVPPSG